MGDTKFTPGPWNVVENAGPFDETLGVSMDSHIQNPYSYRCYHLWSSGGIDTEHPEDVANAHLIAAAPELYEALEWFVRWREALLRSEVLPEKPEVTLVAEAKAALAKARGES